MPKGVGNNSGLRSCSRHSARPTTGFTRRPSAAGDPELRREDVSIAREADYIVARAIAEDAGVVSLGPLVFFSTATGDAWVLDAEDNLALQLAAAGTRGPVAITETRERFAIEWAGTFEIAGSDDLCRQSRQAADGHGIPDSRDRGCPGESQTMKRAAVLDGRSSALAPNADSYSPAAATHRDRQKVQSPSRRRDEGPVVPSEDAGGGAAAWSRWAMPEKSAASLDAVSGAASEDDSSEREIDAIVTAGDESRDAPASAPTEPERPAFAHDVQKLFSPRRGQRAVAPSHARRPRRG
jgi:hypothetical protein